MLQPARWPMKRYAFACAIFTAMIPGASAEWRIDKYTDRMTDEVVNFAVADAKELSGNIAGSLLLLCDKATAKALQIPSRLYIAIRLSEDMPVGATISWRIDEQPVQYQYMPELRRTFMSALHKLSPDALKLARRLRLQWMPTTGTAVFYDFDVSGLERVIADTLWSFFP